MGMPLEARITGDRSFGEPGDTDVDAFIIAQVSHGNSAGSSTICSSVTGVPSDHTPMNRCSGVLPSAYAHHSPLVAHAISPSDNFQITNQSVASMGRLPAPCTALIGGIP